MKRPRLGPWFDDAVVVAAVVLLVWGVAELLR